MMLVSYGCEENKENIPLPGCLPPRMSPIVHREPLPDVSTSSSTSTTASNSRNSFNTVSDEVVLPMVKGDETEDGGDDDADASSRKQKSLGLLCQRFLLAMRAETEGSGSSEVHLESVARKMNVEKRRIYDIVNVMEALDAMSKTNKSYYRWHGLEALPKLMHELQVEATSERLPERILRVEQAMCSFTELSPGARGDLVGSLVSPQSPPSSSLSRSSSSFSHDFSDSQLHSRDRTAKNSLAQLCRRFLMVLLCNPKTNRRVSLDVASTVLIKDTDSEGFEPPSRSRCRRLYDIANVLVALGIIKKVHYLFGTKKIPLFVYSGPEPDLNGLFDASACLERCLSESPLITPVTRPTPRPTPKSSSLAKRSLSQNSLPAPQSKMPRLNSTSLMMELAELAEKERLRVQHETRLHLARPVAQKPPAQPQSPRSLTLSSLRRPFTSLPLFGSSPLDLTKTGLYPALPTGLPPPSLPHLPSASPSISELLCANALQTMLVAQKTSSSTVFSRSPLSKKTSVSHSVSSILGERSASLAHSSSSAFQPLKSTTPSKKIPFGALHNIAS